MTDQLRKAAENAIKVLVNKRLRMDEHLIPIVVDDLRQALAQPNQKETSMTDRGSTGLGSGTFLASGGSVDGSGAGWPTDKYGNQLTNAQIEQRKSLAQPEQEPVAFEDWLKNQHGDPEEIGFLQALRVAYYAGADSHTAQPSKPQDVDVGIDVTEFGTHLVVRRGNEVIKSEFYHAPKREWVSLTDDEVRHIRNQFAWNIATEYFSTLAHAIEAALKERNT